MLEVVQFLADRPYRIGMAEELMAPPLRARLLRSDADEGRRADLPARRTRRRVGRTEQHLPLAFLDQLSEGLIVGFLLRFLGCPDQASGHAPHRSAAHTRQPRRSRRDPRTHVQGRPRGIDVDAVAWTPKGTNFVETTGTPVVQHSVRHPLRGSGALGGRPTFLSTRDSHLTPRFLSFHPRSDSYGDSGNPLTSGWTPVFYRENSACSLVSLISKSRPLCRSISMKQSRPHGTFRPEDLLSLQDAEEAFPPRPSRRSRSPPPRPRPVAHGLHIGKTGGTAVKVALGHPRVRRPYRVILRKHSVRLTAVPEKDFSSSASGSHRALPQWISQPAA